MSDGLKLISRLLRDGSTNVLRDLDEDLFLDDELRQYLYVVDHYSAHGVLPTPTSVLENTGIRVVEAPEPIAYYQDRLTQRRQYNWIRDHFPQLRECVTNRNMEDAANLFAEGARFLRGGRDGQVIRNIYDAGQDMLIAFDARRRSGGGILTRWRRFDNAVGGYQPGNLYTWVARTNVGKTYLSLKQAYNAWVDGYSVMYVSFEMPIEEIMQRNAAFFAQVNPKGLQSGQMSTRAVMRIQTSLDALENVSRYHILGDSLLPRIGAVNSYINEYRPDIVFIDGAGFLRSDNSQKNANRLDRVQDVLDELKQMTLRLQIPIVITMQFNRQAGKKGKDGSLETIGLTDLVSQHSSVVAKIAPANTIADELHIEILKNRHGPMADFKIHYKFSPPNFEEVTDNDWEDTDHDDSLFDDEAA